MSFFCCFLFSVLNIYFHRNYLFVFYLHFPEMWYCILIFISFQASAIYMQNILNTQILLNLIFKIFEYIAESFVYLL